MRYHALSVCLALAAADCSWDASPTSDFITFGAGNAVATEQVEQSGDLWSGRALDNDIIFDSSRLLAPAQPDASSSAPLSQAPSTGLGMGAAQ